jgi:hypothetical protein
MIDNIIVIDLTQFGDKPTNREGEFEMIAKIRQFLVELGIPTNLDTLAYDLYMAKCGACVFSKPWTCRKGWNKIWLTKNTLHIIGYENCDGKHFTKEFLDFMGQITPVVPGEIFWNSNDYIPYCEPEKDEESCTTLDEVLDKIGKYGVDSLTTEELKILSQV